MRLITASFKNFKLLQEIDLSFSVDQSKNLTVIRAANDTGKTTILVALQWGFFGDHHLPKHGSDYRMHPIDWDFKKKSSVEIVVEIEFEHTWERPARKGKFIAETQRYTLVRAAIEKLDSDGNWTRDSSSLVLFEVRDTGHREVPNAEARLKQVMGSNLKDLFFTDGDRALTFITAELSGSDRRRLVKTAITDMLSFEVLDNSRKHIQNSMKKIIEESRALSDSEDFARITTDLAINADRVEKLSAELGTVNQSIDSAQVDIKSDENKLSEVLLAGDRDDLEQRRKSYQSQLQTKQNDYKLLQTNHADLFLMSSLSSSLLSDKIIYTGDLLEKLRKKGVIPKTALPILKERLEIGVCVCGTKLNKGTDHYNAVVRLIKDHESQSELDDLITALKFSNDRTADDLATSKADWIEEKSNRLSLRNKCEEDIDYIKGNLKKTDDEIYMLPDVNVRLLRDKLKASRDNLRQLDKKQALLESSLRRRKQEGQVLDIEYSSLLKQQKSANKTLAKIDVAKDLLDIIEKSLKEIEEIEIPKVTEHMNRYFLEMIQSDQEVNKIIHHAEVTNDYEIRVMNSMNRVLDTDNDLNGASRRALTLSFILALTKVSGVVAPNVIDTPFGMMDPIVKASTLKVLTEEASQVILLLTRSEINDIEDQLSDKTGAVTTLTNLTHYPLKIVNEPVIMESRTVKCDCNHIQYCEVCERIGEARKDGREKREVAQDGRR